MQGQGIPVGFDGQIRRVPGSNLRIDHSHPELEFNLILRGRGAYVLSDRRFELQSGMLVWLQPGQRHRLVRAPGLEMWVVIVRPDLADDAFRRDIAAHPARVLLGDDAVELDRLLSQVAQDADEPDLFNAGLVYALRRARRASRDSAGGARDALHPAVVKALFLLRRHAAASSLDELASACGVTQSYLSRLLVQQTGRGIIEWRNRARLERFQATYAAHRNLLAAALDAGFGSYGQFHRACRELMGCAPREWVRGDPRTAAAPFDIPLPDEPSSAVAPSLPAHTGKSRRPAPRTAPRPLSSPQGVLPALDSSKRTSWHALMHLALPVLVPRWDAGFSRHLLNAGQAPEADTLRDPTLFTPDPVMGKRIRDSFVERVLAFDRQAATHLGLAFDLHDPRSLYVNVVSFFGLDADNVTDPVTAVLAVAWVAANRADDPSVAQVQALRMQCRCAVSRMTSLAKGSDTEKQEMAEAFIGQFSIVFNLLMAARSHGHPVGGEEISEGIALVARRFIGCDLRSLCFGHRGFRKSR